jgi:hypothetical protein
MLVAAKQNRRDEARDIALEFNSPLSLKQLIASPTANEPPPLEPIVIPLPVEAQPLASSSLASEQPLPLRSEKTMRPPADEPTNELVLVAELVGQLGAALARDEEVLDGHGVALQKIDIAVQLLEAVAATATEEGSASEARLAALSVSAREALRAED